MARSSTASASGGQALPALCGLLLALAAGCIETPWTVCEDGMMCPPGRACDVVNGRCSFGGECFGRQDGEPCDDTQGRCLSGVCEDLCGDGEVNGDEECEGTDFGAKSCASEEQTYAGELACTAECSIDYSGCVGWCGDGVLDQGHEVCDPRDDDHAITATCVSRGLDAGRLACQGDCAGLTTDPCMRFGWSLESSEEGQSSGVFRDLSGGSDVLVAVVDPGGVRSASADGAIGWDQVGDHGPTIEGFAVWASSSRDIWVVGGEAIVHRWDGEGWTATEAPMDGLTDVWGRAAGDGSPSEVFAVGREGIIRHDGAKWSVERRVGRADLRAVAGVGPDRVYAVGTVGTLLRREGQTWQVMDSGTSEDLVGVWADPGGDLWTISATSARRFDGRTWRTMATFEPDENGQAWIGGTGAHDVWTSAGPRGEVRRFDGVGWSTLRGPDQIGPQPLWVDRRAVAVGTQDDFGVVAVSRWFGAGEGPLLVRSGQLMDAWGTGADDWIAVGADGETGQGVALHADGRTFSFPQGISLVAGFDGGPAYAAGRNGPLYRWDGDAWSPVTSPIDAIYIDLWTAGRTDVYALLEQEQDRAARVVRFDGERMTPLPPVDPRCGVGARAGWSSGPTDVFVVGSDLLARFDGTEWTCFDGPDVEHFHSVWGSGPDDVWVYQGTGKDGGQARLHHWDGAAWTAQVTRGDGLLTGTASDDVFLGKSMHFDGHAWTPIRAQSIPGFVVHAAPSRLFSITPVFAVGGLGQFVRTRFWQVRDRERGCADGVDDDADGLADADDADCGRVRSSR